MKNMSKLLMLVAVVLFAVSCDNAESNQQASVVDEHSIDLDSHRGAKAEHQAVDRFSLADIDVDLEAMETVAMNQMNAEDADAAAIMSIN